MAASTPESSDGHAQPKHRPDVCKRGTKRKSDADGEGPIRKKTKKSPEVKETKQDLLDNRRADLEAKYQQLDQLGQGGCRSVFAGYRKADHLPVAIKHIPKDNSKQVDKNGKEISVEVAIMLKLDAGTQGSVGTSAPVSLLDWYDLDQELMLVMERPFCSEDLHKYIQVNGGSLQEDESKIILKQLVKAAVECKIENILIETRSDVPCVCIIDFGLSCFVKKHSFFHVFYSTSAHIPPEWYSDFTYWGRPHHGMADGSSSARDATQEDIREH